MVRKYTLQEAFDRYNLLVEVKAAMNTAKYSPTRSRYASIYLLHKATIVREDFVSLCRRSFSNYLPGSEKFSLLLK